jgi:UDP-glucose 4-epimerase
MKQSVLIIGGNGYIGSRLRQVLSQYHTVDSIDSGWFNRDSTSLIMDYRDVTPELLNEYNVIVLLAGHSSVNICNGDIKAPWLNNVTNFENLLTKLNNNHLLIYASSASVYGNSEPGQMHVEENINFNPVNNYDITKYTLDLKAQLAIESGKNIIGLRFGTVNGWSPNLRTDVMINAMFDSAKRNKQIIVTNKHISRALLGIEDLCRAIEACICTQHSTFSGIYNLASFNTTVGEISQIVSRELDVEIEDRGVTDGAYDFGLDCSKFEKRFSFKFLETPYTIVQSLVDGYDKCRIERRDEYITYEWKKYDRS